MKYSFVVHKRVWSAHCVLGSGGTGLAVGPSCSGERCVEGGGRREGWAGWGRGRNAPSAGNRKWYEAVKEACGESWRAFFDITACTSSIIKKYCLLHLVSEGAAAALAAPLPAPRKPPGGSREGSDVSPGPPPPPPPRHLSVTLVSRPCVLWWFTRLSYLLNVRDSV